jgi:hypothetical protein
MTTTTITHPASVRRSRRRVALIALFATTLLPAVAACGGSDSVSTVTTSASGGAGSGSATGSTSGAEPAPSSGAATSEPTPEAPPTSTDTVTDPAGPTAPAAVLAAIRTADRGSYDRVVFEFTGTFGGYSVGYVDELTEDPTGDPVELAGTAILAVAIQGATMNNAFQTSDTVPLAAYTGPKRITPNLPSIKEVADAGDFEAVLSMGVGVGAKVGFRVLKLADPARLVIDIAH